MAVLLSRIAPPSKPPQNPKHISKPFKTGNICSNSKREFALKTAVISLASLIGPPFNALVTAETLPPKSILLGIANTKSWFQFFGDGFAIRVPPGFEDVMEPEDYSAGLSLYGDKVKPKTFAARFASPDGSEVLSVVIRPSNQLKITFLEAKDIADLGSLKNAAKIFVPGGATLYSARTIRIKEAEGLRLRSHMLSDVLKFTNTVFGPNVPHQHVIMPDFIPRTYYFYEFGIDEQHVALAAAIDSGKAFIAGATAPQSKWNDDGVKLRSAAVSLTVL